MLVITIAGGNYFQAQNVKARVHGLRVAGGTFASHIKSMRGGRGAL